VILLFVTVISTTLSGCGVFGLTTGQRASAIEFGGALSTYGRLLAEETSYVRSEAEQMRVLAMSLPSAPSAQLFDNGGSSRLAEGLD
jgi:hypothetical protein